MKHTFRAVVSALCVVCALSGAVAAAAQGEKPEELEVEDILASELPIEVEALPLDPPVQAPVERYFLLLFDSPLGGVRQLDEVSATVEEWIAKELLPTDAAAVVSYYGQELLVAQDFTRDRRALAAAVGAAIRGQAYTGTPPEAGAPSLLARDLSQRADSFYGVLQVLAETVDSVPGPKGLVVFSKGFGRSRGFSEALAGPELGIPVMALAESPVLEKYLPEQGLYEPTLEALLSRQIRLYPVDLATDYSETFPLAGVMSRLAAATEGRYVYPATELARILEQIARTGAPPADQQALTPIPSPAGGRGVQSE